MYIFQLPSLTVLHYTYIHRYMQDFCYAFYSFCITCGQAACCLVAAIFHHLLLQCTRKFDAGVQLRLSLCQDVHTHPPVGLPCVHMNRREDSSHWFTLTRCTILVLGYVINKAYALFCVREETKKVGLIVILAGSKMDDPSLQTARTKLPILVQCIVKTLFWLVGRR